MSSSPELQQFEVGFARVAEEEAARARVTVADRCGFLVDDVPDGEPYDEAQVKAAAGEARSLLEMLGLVEPFARPRKRSGCGSAEGWRRHQRNRTQPCHPCLDAWADYHRERGSRGAE